MNEYVIFTDSSCDLPKDMANELGVSVLQLDVTIAGGEPVPNCNVDISDFYDQLRSKKDASTSAASMSDFLDAFESVLKEGKDIYYIGFSSGLSSTYNWGFAAAQELAEKYPERTVLTTDTLAASLGEGLLVYYACQKRDEGASITEVRDYIESIKLNLCHWFTVDDLFFLKRGGRVSAATAVVGSMLSIKPVMHMDNAGKLINVAKARGRRAAIEALAAKLCETGIDVADQTIFISHGDCIDDAKLLADIIKTKAGVKKEIYINYVGPVIGAHAGPGTLALFFLGTQR